MARIVSFEGCIGAGKTTLVNFFSKELGLEKILEHDYRNPFIDDFYAGADVKLETELTFLLQHYSLLKKAALKHGLILADFSIEKDLVFAKLNLDRREFSAFRNVYDFAVGTVGTQDLVIYLDLPFELLIKRIRRRGRLHEVNADPVYFRTYGDKLRSYFTKETKSKVILIDSNIELSSHNTSGEKLNQIRQIIKGVV